MANKDRRFVLRTSLSPAQAAERLEENMEDDRLIGTSRSSQRFSIIGILEGTKFRLYRRPSFFEDYAGDFEGELFPDPAGTYIVGKFVKAEYRLFFELTIHRQTVLRAKIGFVLLTAGFVALVLWSTLIAGAGFINIPIAFMGVFVILAGLNLRYVFWRSRQGENFILDYLKQIWNATLECQPASE